VSDVAARNHGSQRRHRGGIGSPPAKPKSLGFCSGAPPFVPKRKGTKSLAARADGCGPGDNETSSRMRCESGRSDLSKRCGPDGVSRGDIASELDSQCQNKVLALCGRRGKAGAAKAKSLNGLWGRATAPAVRGRTGRVRSSCRRCRGSWSSRPRHLR